MRPDSHGTHPHLFEYGPPTPHPNLIDDDSDMRRVRDWILREDPEGARFGRIMRESLDQILDGPRTRRFRYSELRKTEKTHVGTIVEINLGKEFDLQNGDATDYRIDGVQVDCKYSMTKAGWAIPLEAVSHIVLLTWANDIESKWSAGLWRVTEEHLNVGKNRDKKTTLAKSGRNQIHWLWDNAPLDENLLLHLPPADVAAIFSHTGSRKGQRRVNELFARVQARIVRREVVLTVAQQKDAPRRARMAREPRQLGKLGIIVLGHYEWDVRIAEALHLPVPRSGEWVSIRVFPVDEGSARPSIDLDGQYWAVAATEEPIVQAPVVPRGRALSDEG